MNKQIINIPASMWVPTIVQVENGYIVSLETPNDDMKITEVYVYSTFAEVCDFLRGNFREEE